jgi:hypothetical protein
MRLFFGVLLGLTSLLCIENLAASASPSQTASMASSQAVQSLERKLIRIQQNGALPKPDPTPTQITETEANAYLASGRVHFPAGVQSVRLQGEAGVITANCRVDFDEFKAGQHNSNPLLAIFSGVHDVVVVTHAHGASHQGFVHVDSVSLDGMEIPHFALELFVEKYIQPRYPGIGIDSQFALPAKIDTATVGKHELTVTQR